MFLERVSQMESITARRFDGGAGEQAGEVKEIEAVVDVLCISLQRARSNFHARVSPAGAGPGCCVKQHRGNWRAECSRTPAFETPGSKTHARPTPPPESSVTLRALDSERSD